jgi:hypothetical protein
MKKDSILKISLLAGLMFLAIMARMVTNEMGIYNFTAIGACALFAGVVIKDRRLAFLVPLLLMFISDTILEFFTPIQGFYGWEMLFVYGAFLLTTWIGTSVRNGKRGTILLASIGSGMLFFVLSNLGTFLLSNMYAKTWDGLVTCFAMAVPFYKADILGNFALNGLFSQVFFTGLLFGAYALIRPLFKKDELVMQQAA